MVYVSNLAICMMAHKNKIQYHFLACLKLIFLVEILLRESDLDRGETYYFLLLR